MNLTIANANFLNYFQNLELITNKLDDFYLILLIIIFAEIGTDALFSQKRNYKETTANIVVGFVQDFISNTLATTVVFFGFLFVSQFRILTIEVSWWTLLIAIIVVDFTYYWMHRLEHRIRIFWGHHSVHHSSTDFNLTVALRLSWLEDFITWIFFIPMLLLGFDPIQTLVAFEINGLYQVWIHNQKIGKLGIFELFFNTPSSHRVHHGANACYIDKNYGGILIIWDRLFGTYEPEKKRVIFGLTKNINTHNPIKINLFEYANIVQDLRRAKSFKDFWMYLFGFPGWNPTDKY